MKPIYLKIYSITLGFLLGLVTMNLFQIHTIDRLYRVQTNLTNQLLDKEIKLQKFNESANEKKVFIVKNLEINIDYEGNPRVIEDIETTIKFYLNDLVGREVKEVDGDMIYKIIHQRILEIDEKKITLILKYIIINETISIGINAR
ncbi:hypothetical protein [Serpentinicella alkaliphila]|uniref:Sporulation membrane protein YtrI C-terminal domain-containing protein n=1 Tax=Serpentinicella alkaliphila TaxID=1734049 RepID=A0A4R2TEH9_9FIRM|nr:hypothetical protein [Serpentinicella alkaliphila]QUH25093.1 hypothetical protein HZR23_04350 [Serpentinicella alkaliphila]TCQ01738.1 hypothetical protein EDD79_102312 [Serpentinicella alkaliphila]